MDPRNASASRSVLVKWMGIEDANSAGFVHGGTVMKLCDEAAGLASVRHSGRRCVTAAMDRMTFLLPVHVGELLTLESSVNAAWRTSVVVSVPVTAEYLAVMSTLLFLALNGHLALLALLIESFSLLPPGIDGLGTAGFAELAGFAGQMFAAATMVALPAATALLVASVSLVLIARSAPQLNIFSVGFPLTLMLGIVTLLFSLPLLAPQFGQLMPAVETDLASRLTDLASARPMSSSVTFCPMKTHGGSML